ncbi:hypothetical protein KL86DES1_21319 [uncultured Desulfovibrio sp.]|uniref:Uncharacterized protein n=1 Tax=uncultured Desulfovibrio sp. TaxID=167968 RepID=A0A212L7G5_9BACT|nr:hypothetical protein KL86DES1_21319 [uncultured Desulfovibrio sp.]VZH34217.1 conserved protein of unknown function [Desulfovibrio sp. 86]
MGKVVFEFVVILCYVMADCHLPESKISLCMSFYNISSPKLQSCIAGLFAMGEFSAFGEIGR